MKTNSSAERLPARKGSRKAAKGTSLAMETPGSILFASALGDAEKREPESLQSPAARQVPAPEGLQQRIQAAAKQFGLLGKALSWFQARATASNQLRLAETVSLGEKRFVAIIHVEGRKFLIGGGTAGVSLLTQLDETA